MKRFAGCFVVMMVLAVPGVPVQAADWAVGAEVNFDLRAPDFGGYAVPIGGFNAFGHAGTFGHVFGPVKTGNPYHGFLGAQWEGPVKVYSLTLNQLVDSGRQRPDVIYLYTDTNPENYIAISLPATWTDGTTIQGKELVVDLTQYTLDGGPILANNSYLLLAVQSPMHPGGNDSNFGVMSFKLNAVAAGAPDVNLNLGATVTGTGRYTGGGNLEYLNDGRIHEGPAYWTRDATPDTLTMTYTAAQESIGSIGLGLIGDANNRDCPMWVDVTATFSDVNKAPVTQRIYIQGEMSQYGRYVLPDGPFFDVMSLTLTMPPGVDDPDKEYVAADNWWLYGDPNYGLTEFQAFAWAPPIPEPATMVLLVMGGLAMLRRRR